MAQKQIFEVVPNNLQKLFFLPGRKVKRIVVIAGFIFLFQDMTRKEKILREQFSLYSHKLPPLRYAFCEFHRAFYSL